MSEKPIIWIQSYNMEESLDSHPRSQRVRRVTGSFQGEMNEENYREWQEVMMQPVELHPLGSVDSGVIETVRELHCWIQEEEKRLEMEFKDDPEVASTLGSVIDEMEIKLGNILKRKEEVKSSPSQYEGFENRWNLRTSPLRLSETQDPRNIASFLGYPNIRGNNGETE